MSDIAACERGEHLRSGRSGFCRRCGQRKYG
jgi:hypothetical protein